MFHGDHDANVKQIKGEHDTRPRPRKNLQHLERHNDREQKQIVQNNRAQRNLEHFVFGAVGKVVDNPVDRVLQLQRHVIQNPALVVRVRDKILLDPVLDDKVLLVNFIYPVQKPREIRADQRIEIVQKLPLAIEKKQPRQPVLGQDFIRTHANHNNKEQEGVEHAEDHDADLVAGNLEGPVVVQKVKDVA